MCLSVQPREKRTQNGGVLYEPFTQSLLIASHQLMDLVLVC